MGGSWGPRAGDCRDQRRPRKRSMYETGKAPTRTASAGKRTEVEPGEDMPWSTSNVAKEPPTTSGGCVVKGAQYESTPLEGTPHQPEGTGKRTGHIRL